MTDISTLVRLEEVDPFAPERIGSMRDISRGEFAWGKIWQELDFDIKDELTPERVETLQEATKITLRKLKEKDYESFCSEALTYKIRCDERGERIFEDFPFKEDPRDVYKQEFKILRKNWNYANAFGQIGAIFMGALAGIFGAVTIGHLGYNLTEVQDTAYIFAGIGAPIVGLAEGGLTYGLFDCLKKDFEDKGKEFHKLVEDEFHAQVRQYAGVDN